MGPSRALRCLGAPELCLDGELLSLTRQHLRLFAALVAAGPTGLDADGLLEELWGEDVPRSRNQAVYSLVNRLDNDASRFVVNEAGRYRVAPEVDVDTWRFRTLVDSERPDALVDALRLWQGRPFDTVEAGDVVAAEVESLRRSRSTAAETAARSVDVRLLRSIERQIHDSVSDDPYNEPLAIATAGALFRLRKRRDALSVIQACRARLRGDLGLDGSGELDDAELALLRDTDPLAEGTATPGPAPTASLPGLLTPRASTFVDRESPMLAVEAAIAAVQADGRGRIVLIAGDAGMGKSEFVAQVAAQQSDCTLRVGGAGPAASAAYAEWFRALPEVSDDIDALSRAVDPGIARLVFWRAVERALAEISRLAPLLFVLEDMHDSDEQSARLFGWLSSGSLPSGVVLVATTRSPEPGSPWAQTVENVRGNADRGVATVIDLQPLSVAAIESMVASRFPDEPPARLHRFASQVHALSLGNPLVTGSLIADAGTADDIATAADRSVEDQHAHAVRNRVDGTVAGVLTNAGLIGTEFSLELLAELCEMTPSATLVHIEAAMANGLVIETEQIGRFRFDHVLTAEAFAQRASRTRRGQTFVRLAEASEVSPADRVRYIRGAGTLLPAEVAARLLEAEGAKLADAHAFSEAQAAFELAVDRLRADGTEASFELLVGCGEAAARAGDFKKLTTHRAAAFASARSRSADDMTRAALVGLPASERAEGDADLVELLREIPADQIVDPVRRGLFLQQFVRAARFDDRPELALETIDNVSRSDIGSDEMWAVFQGERIMLENQLRHTPDATVEFDELLDGVAPGLVRTRLRYLQFLMALTAQDEDALSVRLGEAKAEAFDLPVPRVRWGLELAEATLTQLGLLDSSIDAAAALATGFRLGIADAFAAYGAQAWQQLWIDDRLDEALSLLDGAKGMIPPNVGWTSAEALGAAAAGDRDRARQLLDDALPILGDKPHGVWAPIAAALVVETAERMTVPELVIRAAVGSLAPHSGSAIVLGICAAYLGPADGYLARAHRLLGDGAADQYRTSALEQIERTGAGHFTETLSW